MEFTAQTSQLSDTLQLRESEGGDLLKVIQGERRDVSGVEKAVAVIRRGEPGKLGVEPRREPMLFFHQPL